jgi:hypothetical protein
MSLAYSIDIPLQALTYLSHIWVQKPLRVGPRQCPRQCVEGGAISRFGAYISYMCVVHILLHRRWCEFIFL